MNKRTKLAVLVGAIAAVISAIVLVIVFWDKLLEKCPCRKLRWDEDNCIPDCDDAPADDVLPYNEDELEDYADLHHPEI